MLLFLGAVLFALSLSFLCSLMEATLLSFSPGQVAELSVHHPRLGAIWMRFKERIDRPIAVILMINTAAHTIGASVAGSQFDQLYGDKWIWIFSLVFTFLMLQFTEILPKTLGVRYARELAIIIARPLRTATTLLEPVLRLLYWLNRPFDRSGGRRQAQRQTVEELAALAGVARVAREINPYQERIIKGASRLSQRRARQVMIPVEQVSFLSTSQTLHEAVLAAHNDPHTRFPVCESDDRNRVVGYVNFKEMIYYMRTNPRTPSLIGIIRPVHFVPPDMVAAEMLRAFVDQYTHIAIVRDDRDTTLGLVTLEDLVEELVGELEDEFDRLPVRLHALTGGVWLAGGGLSLRDLFGQLALPPPSEGRSVSEWIVGRLGRAPTPGDSFAFDRFRCEVRRVRRGRVFEAAIVPVRNSAHDDAAPPCFEGRDI